MQDPERPVSRPKGPGEKANEAGQSSPAQPQAQGGVDLQQRVRELETQLERAKAERLEMERRLAVAEAKIGRFEPSIPLVHTVPARMDALEARMVAVEVLGAYAPEMARLVAEMTGIRQELKAAAADIADLKRRPSTRS